jgi:hypothetical protein
VGTANAGPPPAAAGGTAPDGKYVLTSLVFYNSPRPVPLSTKITIEKKGTTLDAITTDAKGDARSTATVTLAGVDLTLTETCSFPAKDAGTKTDKGTFTATATELKLYSAIGAVTVEQTYTKK